MSEASGVDSAIEQLIASVHVDQPDEEHARRCAGFAATLFDGLAPALEMDLADRNLAILAAYLHDVGYSRGGRDHHRKSFDVVREMALPIERPEDQIVAACVTRYHGETLPSIEHAGFQDLDFEDQRRVRRLTGIVRLAASLDASHLGLVTAVDVAGRGEHPIVLAYASEEPAVERDRLRTAAASLRMLAGLDLRTDIVVRRRA